MHADAYSINCISGACTTISQSPLEKIFVVHFSMILRGLWNHQQIRKYRKPRTPSGDDSVSTCKTNIAKLMTMSSQPFVGESRPNYAASRSLSTLDISAVEAVARRSILEFAFSHPELDGDAVFDKWKLESSEMSWISSHSMNARKAFAELIAQTEHTKLKSRFIHADLLLKRDSKQQVTILVDTADLRSVNFKHFFFSPIDFNVMRSKLSSLSSSCSSLVLQKVPESLMEDLPIAVSCTDCDFQNSIRECELQTNPPILSRDDCKKVHHKSNLSCLNPGGGRTYYGPVVPSLRNVWLGSVEKFTQKKNERLGIIIATVFQILKDPSAGRSKKIQLPSPDPLVQWTMLPILQCEPNKPTTSD